MNWPNWGDQRFGFSEVLLKGELWERCTLWKLLQLKILCLQGFLWLSSLS